MEQQVSLHSTTINGKHFLEFDFPEYLTTQMVEDTIPLWKEMYNKIEPGEKADLVFNCEIMSGFDTEARRKWQSIMKELKSQTGEIWIVSDNIFILGAAKTMGLLTGYSIKVTRAMSEVGK